MDIVVATYYVAYSDSNTKLDAKIWFGNAIFRLKIPLNELRVLKFLSLRFDKTPLDAFIFLTDLKNIVFDNCDKSHEFSTMIDTI